MSPTLTFAESDGYTVMILRVLDSGKAFLSFFFFFFFPGPTCRDSGGAGRHRKLEGHAEERGGSPRLRTRKPT